MEFSEKVQNKYSGDIGDFSKFMLLKHVIGSSFGNTGIVWYTHPNEVHNNDGKHIAYLKNPDYRNADPDLVERLKQVVDHQERNEKGIKFLEHFVLPSSSQSYSDFVPLKEEARDSWLDRALDQMNKCPVVILDPDNGLEPEKPTKSRKPRKYVFEKEIIRFFRKSRILILYQHFTRNGTHPLQIKLCKERLTEIIPESKILAMRFRGWSPRCYFIMAQTDEDESLLHHSIRNFLENSRLSIGWDKDSSMEFSRPGWKSDKISIFTEEKETD